MSSFTPYNVEPDSDTEYEEIDDTKEIQVEEALKLYQYALKLHAQGPSSFDDAEEAYDALFQSEVFSYPESQSEAKRLELQDEVESDLDDLEPDLRPLPAGGVDAAPNALPQILYLSYKNYGQFLLDRLAEEVNQIVRSDTLESRSKERLIGTRSLQRFAEALDRDGTDSDLWMRMAKLGRILGSRRLARYCFEAILDEDEDDFGLADDGPMETAVAREELQDLLSAYTAGPASHLSDTVVHRTKPLSSAVKAVVDPCPKIKNLPSLPPSDSIGIVKTIVVRPTWEAVAKAILEELELELDDESNRMATRVMISFGEEERRTHESDTPPFVMASEILPKEQITRELVLSPKEPPASARDPKDTKEATAQSPKTLNAATDSGANREVDETAADAARPDAPTEDSHIPEAGALQASPVKQSHNDDESANAVDSRRLLKRKSDAAELDDAAEGVRVRSKRLRAKAEMAEEENEPKDLTQYYEEQLQPCYQADDDLFTTVDALCSRFGKPSFQQATQRRQHVYAQRDPHQALEGQPLATAVDFKDALCQWTLNNSNLLLQGSGSGASVTLIGGGDDDSGSSSFLEHSKPTNTCTVDLNELTNEGVRELASIVQASWMNIEQLSVLYVERLLGLISQEARPSLEPSKYAQYLWSPDLKETVVSLLSVQDNAVFKALERRVFELKSSSGDDVPGGERNHEPFEDLQHIVQTIFELHLDRYQEATQPNSKVDQPSRVMQKDRLHRWAQLSNWALNGEVEADLDEALKNRLAVRHVWSSVVYVSLIEAASRDHIILCLQNLESILKRLDIQPIQLRNNEAMPVISVEAAEAEIARLTTMDFFLGIFDPNLDQPVDVIEALEPILMSPLTTKSKSDTPRSPTSEECETKEDGTRASNPASEFLKTANTSLRLSLWHRLTTAYEAIDYPPMVFVCNMRSLNIVLSEILSASFSSDDQQSRTPNLIVWLRNIIDLVTHCTDLALADPKALLCLDEANLDVALDVCCKTIELLHVFALWEDAIRVGQLQAPTQPTGGAVPYRSSMNFLRDVQPKLWILLYFLLREMLSQNPQICPNPQQELLGLLAIIHRSLGAREYCRLAKKLFLKFVKSELLSLRAALEAETELAQVLFDLHGLKLCPESELEDHGCMAEPLDRATALDIIEFVMIQARRMNIKDLLKSDIKAATEKMQAIIGKPRASSLHQAFNRRLILAHLRSPINPMNLYRSFKGLGGLTGMPVTSDYAAVANQRWFFLLGHILLAKHRSQKRTNPDTSDDLDDAIVYFKMDLDFDTENWETWYRLGQAYDSKIEEDTTWNADKINDDKSDLVALQRQTIQCYTMALAVAVRSADDSPETSAKMTELYTDFGNRVYASSRAPFSMQVFGLQDYERFCNEANRGTYRREPFRPLSEEAAWAFASELYRLALADRPKEWTNWFMLGKCLWKLYGSPRVSDVDPGEPLDAFIRAIECAPEKRDSRHPDRDPILEPHYKLVSVVHKLVHRGRIPCEEGAQMLTVSSHTRKVQLASPSEWKEYTLAVLKSLRAVDKSNWHHRMVARAAHIHYDDDPHNVHAVEAAKNELTQQIFTKTMTVQVWKPEYERAGRHFVYTTEYVRFFVRLLSQTGDRAGLENLGKKVRRKQGDFVDHALVWAEIVQAHLRLLRLQGDIPAGHEEAVFKSQLPHDVFTLNANRLEAWAHAAPAPMHPTLDQLREAVELKKLTGTLLRAALLDDFIGDAYARLYERVVPGLVAEAGAAENRERMRIDRMLMADDSEQPTRTSTPSEQAPAVSTRVKTIGRTEVRRRAEALVARPNAVGPPARGRPAAGGAGREQQRA